MTERKPETAEKLPYARRYLRTARCGLNALLEQKPMGGAYFFYVNGLFSTMRACQNVLLIRDSKLSERHKEVIGAWKQKTKDWKQIPELYFIKKARDKLDRKSTRLNSSH